MNNPSNDSSRVERRIMGLTLLQFMSLVAIAGIVLTVVCRYLF